MIRCRAWDGETMMNNVSILLIEEKMAYPRDRSWIHNCMDWDDGGLMDNPVVMYQIGLQDRWGQELFQGDIVRVASDNDGEIHISEVDADLQSGIFIKDEGLRYDMAMYEYGLHTQNFEIIGNKYQNPELLEAK